MIEQCNDNSKIYRVEFRTVLLRAGISAEKTESPTTTEHGRPSNQAADTTLGVLEFTNDDCI